MDKFLDMDGKVYNRYDTADNWALVNPVLGRGELGIEDGMNVKCGDGVTAWNDLPYMLNMKQLNVCPYAVGDIYITLSDVDPATRWAGTTWEKIPGGHCIVSAGTNPDTGTVFALGATGGEEKHQLSVGELPSHRHIGLDIDNVYVFGWDSGSLKGFDFQSVSTGYSTANRITTGYTGNNSSHNNLQPYKAVYLWQRIS
ncbi:phage baseplate protein [Phascolarctobacterium sp.]|uniref:phage baseplate protein n=1 Tax=Phascolarctobacterium sp. TaxID=2049039 RepID=UPI00386E070B